MQGSIGTGTTVTFGTSAFVAHITSVAHDGVERAVIDTSHLGSEKWRTKIPGLLTEPGALTSEFNYDPNDDPPIQGDVEPITVAFPLSQGNFVFQGFMASWNWSAPLEEIMTGSMTIQSTGELTFPGSGTGTGSGTGSGA